MLNFFDFNSFIGPAFMLSYSYATGLHNAKQEIWYGEIDPDEGSRITIDHEISIKEAIQEIHSFVSSKHNPGYTATFRYGNKYIYVHVPQHALYGQMSIRTPNQSNKSVYHWQALSNRKISRKMAAQLIKKHITLGNISIGNTILG